MVVSHANLIASLDDAQLESFVEDWIASKKGEYVDSHRWSGPGDLGRDVVGYLTLARHEGEWDNFQCKQLNKKLSEKSAFIELGKIFMNCAAGHYTLPRRYVFIAPRGVVRTIKDHISKPAHFKQSFIEKWDEYCAPNLVEGQSTALSDEIRAKISSFDFSNVEALDAARLSKDPSTKAALVKWFGEDPGAAPIGVAPTAILTEESGYIKQLVDAYGERLGKPHIDTSAVLADVNWGPHFQDQRTRYFDAAEFKRYYRDSVPHDYIVSFEEDIYQGVIDVCRDDHHPDALARALSVLSQAATLQLSGALAKYARIAVKQGICHHFANEGRLKWKQ